MSLDKEGGLPLTLHAVDDEDGVQNDDDAKDGACNYDDGDDHEKCCYFLQKRGRPTINTSKISVWPLFYVYVKFTLCELYS